MSNKPLSRFWRRWRRRLVLWGGILGVFGAIAANIQTIQLLLDRALDEVWPEFPGDVSVNIVKAGTPSALRCVLKDTATYLAIDSGDVPIAQDEECQERLASLLALGRSKNPEEAVASAEFFVIRNERSTQIALVEVFDTGGRSIKLPNIRPDQARAICIRFNARAGHSSFGEDLKSVQITVERGGRAAILQASEFVIAGSPVAAGGKCPNVVQMYPPQRQP